MDVITIESDAFKRLLSKIEDIEQHIKRTSDLLLDIEDILEMTTREVIETLRTSESTVYRWRQDKLVAYRYDESGAVRFLFKDLYHAIRYSKISLQGIFKRDLLIQMDEFKNNFIKSGLLEILKDND